MSAAHLLSYYFRRRGIDNDFEKLHELIVNDRLISCLPNGITHEK